jgi:hypothetical protein
MRRRPPRCGNTLDAIIWRMDHMSYVRRFDHVGITVVDRVAKDGFGLVGGIGEYEGVWKMAYVRGPEGIIVSLAQRIG